MTTASGSSTPLPPQEPQTHFPVSTVAATIAALLIIAGAVYLLATNRAGAQWAQDYDPTGHWWLSTMLAALPVVVLLGSMALLKMRAHMSALVGLLTALGIAIFVFHVPVRLGLTAAVYGAGYGLFPICWIILPVIFMYKLTVHSGRFETLQRSLTNVTGDSRLQLLLIAFAFGAFFEGAGGFGAPVAVCGALLIGLGFRPLQAAGLALIANTAPVAFGGLGIPIIALHGVTGLDILVLSKVVARILTPFCILIPFWLIWAFMGFRAMMEVWPAILVAGVTFAFSQLAMATLNGPWLVDIVASVVTIIVLILFLMVWKPKRVLNAAGEDITHLPKTVHSMSRGTVFGAWLPWGVLSVLVFVWGTATFQRTVGTIGLLKIPVTGLHLMVLRIPPAALKPTAEAAIYTLNSLSATGTGILVAAVISGLLMGLGPLTILKVFGRTILSVRFTLMTIAAMLALGFVTRYCGLDTTLALAFARTGALYPFFGTLVGWVGTASTGSDTSSNVLFGSLQKVTAEQIGVSSTLMAAANSTGGVMGKMIDAQSIVVASTATQSYGNEGAILRFVFFHSLALACLVGILVYLMAYVFPFTRMAIP